MGTPAPREQSGFVLPHGGQRAGHSASRGVLGAADPAFFLPAHPRVAPQGCERSQVPPGRGAQGRAPCTHPLPLLGSGCSCPTLGCHVPPSQLGPGDALSPALRPQQPPRALCHQLPAELLHTDRDLLPRGAALSPCIPPPLPFPLPSPMGSRLHWHPELQPSSKTKRSSQRLPEQQPPWNSEGMERGRCPPAAGGAGDGGGPGCRRSTRGGRSAGELARPAKAGWFRPSPSPKG